MSQMGAPLATATKILGGMVYFMRRPFDDRNYIHEQNTAVQWRVEAEKLPTGLLQIEGGLNGV